MNMVRISWKEKRKINKDRKIKEEVDGKKVKKRKGRKKGGEERRKKKEKKGKKGEGE